MPRPISFRPAAACALALLVSLCVAAPAVARGPKIDLRVVGAGGKVLAEKSLRAGTASVKTSPQATCFGAGTGGSGKSVKVPGPTPLGALIRASKSAAALKPLRISDHFDFGLALCGVGKSVAKGSASWYLKVNHKSPSLGGDSVKLKAGDEVLWDLAPSFPYPDELALVAPDRVKKGAPFGVRVFSYDDRGKKSPVAGVKVKGATSPTAANGRTTVVLTKPARLIARHGKDIPSNTEAVCVGGKCPRNAGR